MPELICKIVGSCLADQMHMHIHQARQTSVGVKNNLPTGRVSFILANGCDGSYLVAEDAYLLVFLKLATTSIIFAQRISILLAAAATTGERIKIR